MSEAEAPKTQRDVLAAISKRGDELQKMIGVLQDACEQHIKAAQEHLKTMKTSSKRKFAAITGATSHLYNLINATGENQILINQLLLQRIAPLEDIYTLIIKVLEKGDPEFSNKIREEAKLLLAERKVAVESQSAEAADKKLLEASVQSVKGDVDQPSLIQI
jgi:vacuolar-type H+-ATPase subunit H